MKTSSSPTILPFYSWCTSLIHWLSLSGSSLLHKMHNLVGEKFFLFLQILTTWGIPLSSPFLTSCRAPGTPFAPKFPLVPLPVDTIQNLMKQNLLSLRKKATSLFKVSPRMSILAVFLLRASFTLWCLIENLVWEGPALSQDPYCLVLGITIPGIFFPSVN